jgi:hypothetical protein
MTTSLPGPASVASAVSAPVSPDSHGGLLPRLPGTWMQRGKPATAGWPSSPRKKAPQTMRVGSPTSPTSTRVPVAARASSIDDS